MCGRKFFTDSLLIECLDLTKGIMRVISSPESITVPVKDRSSRKRQDHEAASAR